VLLAEPESPTCLLFDEVEDVFGQGDGGFFGNDSTRPENLRKSWINDSLASNVVPSIWISNSIAGIDAAHLRRFDLVLELPRPPRNVRRAIVQRYFEDSVPPSKER
jgi:SpoVK/Ycf46/Vps4 family AAA+-type ATPase